MTARPGLPLAATARGKRKKTALCLGLATRAGWYIRLQLPLSMAATSKHTWAWPKNSKVDTVNIRLALGNPLQKTVQHYQHIS